MTFFSSLALLRLLICPELEDTSLFLQAKPGKAKREAAQEQMLDHDPQDKVPDLEWLTRLMQCSFQSLDAGVELITR